MNADLETRSRDLVTIEGLVAGYGDLQVLKGVNTSIHEGELLGIVGHNGAGKSTLLNVIAGVLPPRSGRVHFDDVGDAPGGVRVAMVPQSLAVFPRMSVRENLEIPRIANRSNPNLVAVEEIFELFPALKTRINQTAGTLSGGEQRMLAVGMALRLAPHLLLLDEPSLGLAPNLVVRIMESVDEARRRFQSTVVIVEQNLEALLERADRILAIRQGEVIWQGTPGEISDTRKLWELY